MSHRSSHIFGSLIGNDWFVPNNFWQWRNPVPPQSTIVWSFVAAARRVRVDSSIPAYLPGRPALP